MSEQQVLNYLLWLRERGQTYLVPREPRVEIYPPIKVLFISTHVLEASELDMVTRIASALTLSSQDFVIAAATEASARIAKQSWKHIVALGDDALGLIDDLESRGDSLLTIAHPSAMLREPTLKVSAWTTLQKLKAALS